MRIFLAGITYASLFFGFPVVTMISAVILAARWYAWEVLVLGVFIDFLYSPLGGVFGVPFLATILGFIVVWGLEPLRVRLYEE